MMNKIINKIKSTIINHVVEEYATEKNGELVVKPKIVLPNDTASNLKEVINDINCYMDDNSEPNNKLKSILELIDEGSIINQYVNFNIEENIQRNFESFSGHDTGDNGSSLMEKASELTSNNMSDLEDQFIDEVKKLYELLP